MLRIVDLKKDYAVAGEPVHALKGINLNFRRSEFVSILGPSGCGKTTLLNIIGGLDNYTSGDLLIEGKSTKTYSDRDWDTYRNHSIGFIFQSYHLIPHQTILQNVELALMIAGVSKKDRRRRAIEALDKVGLSDKIHNKPNQLSGGQAQRVAIARALINDPEIVLADEPTGALDSATSVQIMELLKEISRDRLVIMVTHNPELAERYSTRIVKLLDGEVVGDDMPYSAEEEAAERDFSAAAGTVGFARANAAVSENAAEATAVASGEENGGDNNKKDERNNGGFDGGAPRKVNKGKKKQSSMSMGMAFGLSLKNLLSKHKRTTMVSVAGSIGIIGVSLVLAISSGVRGYISNMENDMLSGYPVSITQSSYDFTSLMELSQPDVDVDLKELAENKKIYVNSLLDTLGTFATGFQKTNYISEAYVDYVSKIPEEQLNLIQYKYGFNIANSLYTNFTVTDNMQDHLNNGGNADDYTVDYNMSVTAIRAMYSEVLQKVPEYKQWGSMISSVSTFEEIPDNFDYIMSQYDVVAIDKDGQPATEGYTQEELKELFEAKETMIMVVSDYEIDDLTLAQYGYFTEDQFLNYAYKGIDDDGNGQSITLVGEGGLDYSFFIGDNAKKFTYYPNDCVYNENSYIPSPTLSDYTIDYLFGSINDQTTGKTLSALIIETRNTLGDEGLRDLYNNNATLKYVLSQYEQNMSESEFIDAFHLPTEEDRVSGYIANAYTTQYTIDNDTPFDTSDDIVLQAFEDSEAYSERVELGVKIILEKKESVSYGCLDSGFYYTKALTDYILDTEKDSEIVKYIEDNGDLTEVPMYVDYYYVEDRYYYIPATAKSSIETGASAMSQIIDSVTGTATTETLGAALFGGDKLPTAMYVYPVDFNAKNEICAYLDKWNDMCTRVGEDGKTVIGTEYTYTGFDGEEHTVTLGEKDQINYNDTVGLIINMVNTMINMITIALVVFTALSLVVSTVMIGIITYVSVVERIKEIGILRAVGARKKDIKRLFNAETFIIGLAAGLFGILITYVLSLIINIIVGALAGFWGIAALPWWQALIMVVLSVCLTLISGLIPASAAAKKDPVVALRTE